MFFNSKQVTSFLLLAVGVQGARQGFYEAEGSRDLQLFGGGLGGLGGGLGGLLSALAAIFGGGFGIFQPSELDQCLIEAASVVPDFPGVAAGKPGLVPGFALTPQACLTEVLAITSDPATLLPVVACLDAEGFGVTVPELDFIFGDPLPTLITANFQQNLGIDFSTLEYTTGVGSSGSGALCYTAAGPNPSATTAFIDPAIPAGGFPLAAFNDASIKVKPVGVDIDAGDFFEATVFVRATQILGGGETATCSYFTERELPVASGFGLVNFNCFESKPSTFNGPSCPPTLAEAKSAGLILGRDDGSIFEFTGIVEESPDQGFFGGFFNQFIPKKEVKSIGFCVDEITINLEGVGVIGIDFEVA